MRFALLLCAILLLLQGADAADRWELQYFYDKQDSSLTINDMVFPSGNRGIAAGYRNDKGKTKPCVLVTSDGGNTWSIIEVKQAPESLFFLNDSVGWMVTGRGLWKTLESGRSWKKVKSPNGILRVYFLSEQRGWAVGERKSVYETADGGENWKSLEAAEQVKANPDFTAFTWITFAGGKAGIIAGASSPPRRDEGRLPDWMTPDRASRRREWPELNILLESRDGGQQWKANTTSMFGNITRVRLSPEGSGLGLIEFFHSFRWPSEVFRIDWQTGKSERVFRREDCAVTDVAVPGGGAAYLAGFEPEGKLVRTPIPGRVRIFRSGDLSHWEPMEVDYRATARRVMLSAPDSGHVWAATDTGMILRLAKTQKQ